MEPGHRLRWKLCKLFRVPVDSEKLNTINGVQMVWYQFQDSLDDKDSFEMLRDVAEHNAMFSNPEGVQQIRDARKNTYETPPDDFSQLIQEAFGRPMPVIDEKNRTTSDLIDDIKSSEIIKPYLDFELDEVTFTPFE